MSSVSGFRLPSNPVVGVLAAFVGILTLATLWHAMGLASEPSQDGYEFTSYFTGCVSWSFVTAYGLISVALGWLRQRKWAVAIGMVLPLPIAFLIEVIQDPTSHNLFPFEVLLFWVPAFAISFFGTYAGLWLRARPVRGTE